MAPSRLSLKRTLLLSAFAALSVFSVTALAQDESSNTGVSTGGDAPSPSTNAPATTEQQNNTPAPAVTTPADSPSPTTNAPVVITGANTETGGGGLTKAPSLTRGPSTRAYPPPTPPPTADAPFMHRSSLPDGTVFIAVGSILGAFGLAVLVWRAIVACLLHRSVARAAAAQHAANDKAALFTAPSAPPFYQHTANSMERTDSPSGLAPMGAGRGARRSRGPTPSATPSMTNLFFSPTANNNNNGAMPSAAVQDRTSRYLPSGFYAAAGTAPTGSMTNLRPEDSPRAYGHHTNSSRHTLDVSPPPSPRPVMPRDTRDLSSTSLSHPNSPGVRAPSTYLENMLADNPAAFPNQMPSQRDTHHRHPSHGSNRL